MVSAGTDALARFSLMPAPGNTLMALILISFFFQYYEMSYGLNIEMHKQVMVLFLLLMIPSVVANS